MWSGKFLKLLIAHVSIFFLYILPINKHNYTCNKNFYHGSDNIKKYTCHTFYDTFQNFKVFLLVLRILWS